MNYSPPKSWYYLQKQRARRGAGDLVLSAPVLDLQAASDTGSSSTDDITGDTTPDFNATFSGGVAVGDVVRVRDNGSELTTYTVVAGDVATGIIPLGLSALANGVHVISARLERQVGGVWSYGEYGQITITITATPP